MKPATVLPLTRLGEYELCRLIATGNTSEVYEARRIGPHGFTRRVAVKRVLPQLASDVRFVRTFCDEARVHAGLSHPNLVAVLDFGEASGELYMAMEYVDGTSLAEVMGTGEGRPPFTLPAALRIARELLSALAYVHTACTAEGVPLGLVHRHVAPSNVLLGASGEVKLTDFGIVRSAATETRTLPGELRGKLGYVSPEQAMGARVDARSDIFSLGVILAEMLLGAPLFPGQSELEVLTHLHAGDLGQLDVHGRHLPPEVHTSLRRFLAQRPVERLASARLASQEIDRLVTCLNAALGPRGLAEYLLDRASVPLVSNTRMKAARSQSSKLEMASSLAPFGPTAVSEPAVSYRVRRPGGTIVGPLGLARVVEMIATARAGLDSEVSRNDGPFMPIGAMTELARLAGRPAYRFFEPIALMATERHAIVPGLVARQLFLAVRQRRTGLLAVRRGMTQRRFYFVDGRLTASASTEPDELLGAVLVESGSVTTAEVDRALERGLRSGRSLGAELVHAHQVDEQGVLAAARQQCQRRLARAFMLGQGELFYVEAAASGEAERPLDPPGQQRLLVEAVRGGLPGEAALAVLVPQMHEALVTCPNYQEFCADLGLSAEETRVILGVRSKGEIAETLDRLSSEARGSAARAIFIGLVSGALRRKRD